MTMPQQVAHAPGRPVQSGLTTLLRLSDHLPSPTPLALQQSQGLMPALPWGHGGPGMYSEMPAGIPGYGVISQVPPMPLLAGGHVAQPLPVQNFDMMGAQMMQCPTSCGPFDANQSGVPLNGMVQPLPQHYCQMQQLPQFQQMQPMMQMPVLPQLESTEAMHGQCGLVGGQMPMPQSMPAPQLAAA